MKYLIILNLAIVMVFTQCKSQEIKSSNQAALIDPMDLILNDPLEQIGQYIVEIFEDSKGNLWIGTIQHGVAKYDGNRLKYYTDADGLAGNAVVDIEEDENGMLWIGTQSGLSTFDGKEFVNYKQNRGADWERISNVLIDKNGLIWIGTWAGVTTFKDGVFTEVDLILPDVQRYSYQTTMDWVTELMEDEEGNIWIGRDGYGACKYDGNEFNCLTKEEGLPSNNVTDIVESKDGDLWIGTRIVERDKPGGEAKGESGLIRISKGKIHDYRDIPGLSRSDVYEIYEDEKGIVYIGTINKGLYKYGPRGFTLYFFEDQEEGSGLPVQSLLKDSKGDLWIGCSGGLYKLEGEVIVPYPKGKFI